MLIYYNQKKISGKIPSFSYISVYWYSLTNFNLIVKHYRPLNSHGFTVCHTVSLPFSRSHGRFFISYAFKNFEQIFLKLTVSKKTQGAHSSVNKERISSMINKNKTSIRSSLSLSWALLHIMLVKTHIDIPFQWKTPSDLLKTAKRFTAKYNQFSIQ